MTSAKEKPFAPVSVRVCANAISVRIVHDLTDYLKVVSLRALVYMGEQACPYSEEFDGCDLSGVTHLLAEEAGEPVGTLRLRWFADFVKIERVAVLPSHRGRHAVRALMAHAVEIARRRGYRRALGYAQVRLLPFWRTLGFHPRPDRARFVFSDHEYQEVEGALLEHPNRITMDTSPLELLRPDGAWDAPGVLDLSASRGAPAQS